VGKRERKTSPGLDVRTPRSHDEIDKGGEEFYTAQHGRCTDLP
jgi:hypothetical protein